ncbi:MarR family transcriptional regulator (plasmid) [Novosphingobium resinovorum]|uniref:MarR family winged helix-turn-helix transcriptional regulator n=1 Tax=Novosphingobium TaxID=165696 RepID=UPI001B3C76CD|nr:MULTISPECIES: MarR family transcriptional regulator [Novosphingobium]MBF7015288.1 MarR family transcriptional regulator [Novosphingobium sp. HR1a]WJM29967.1 MarR family transcriptional regulator [Novosphingobium resinovorum]
MNKRGSEIEQSSGNHSQTTTQEGYLPHDLQRLINALDKKLLEYLRPLNFTPQQYRVLQIVSQLNPISIGEIARLAVIEQSVVSRMVDQLRYRKILTKAKRSDNGRVVDVQLTTTGRALADELQPVAEAIVKQSTEILTEKERALLTKTLSRVFDHVMATNSAVPETLGSRVSAPDDETGGTPPTIEAIESSSRRAQPVHQSAGSKGGR